MQKNFGILSGKAGQMNFLFKVLWLLQLFVAPRCPSPWFVSVMTRIQRKNKRARSVRFRLF